MSRLTALPELEFATGVVPDEEVVTILLLPIGDLTHIAAAMLGSGTKYGTTSLASLRRYIERLPTDLDLRVTLVVCRDNLKVATELEAWLTGQAEAKNFSLASHHVSYSTSEAMQRWHVLLKRFLKFRAA
jgi:hypothetical protein